MCRDQYINKHRSIRLVRRTLHKAYPRLTLYNRRRRQVHYPYQSTQTIGQAWQKDGKMQQSPIHTSAESLLACSCRRRRLWRCPGGRGVKLLAVWAEGWQNVKEPNTYLVTSAESLLACSFLSKKEYVCLYFSSESNRGVSWLCVKRLFPFGICGNFYKPIINKIIRRLALTQYENGSFSV